MSEDKNLKDAQYRKSLSISYFNSLNAAIALVKDMEVNGDVGLEKAIKKWRDFFITEHSDYYAKTIASVGEPYNAEKTMANLRKAKTMPDLLEKWLNLSQDERRDKAIINAVAEMKGKLGKKEPKVEKPLPVKPATKPNEKPRQHKAGKPGVAPNKKG